MNKCPCTTCGTNIEFPKYVLSQRVTCPSCGALTLLTVAPAVPTPRPVASTPQASAPSSFVTHTFDEFTNTTVTAHVNTTETVTDNLGLDYAFSLILVEANNISTLILGCHGCEGSLGWKEIIINCDQENETASSFEPKCENLFPKCKNPKCSSVWDSFKLNELFLKKICDAQSVKLRTEDSVLTIEDPEWGSNFQNYCRQFYNNVYDSNQYAESLIIAEVKPENSPGCFVATACYGNSEHPIVVELRRFRDEVLTITQAGRILIAWYYQWSPKFAGFIGKSAALKALSRMLIVLPALCVSRAIIRKEHGIKSL